MRDRRVDRKVMKAAKDDKLFEELIWENETFILSLASKFSHKYITKSDDEWSVALSAFSQAVADYSFNKGAFFRFAEIVVHRRMIDYFRQQEKFKNEIPVDPSLIGEENPDDSESDNKETNMGGSRLNQSNAQENKALREDSLREEIRNASDTINQFGFSFMDLTKYSPKSKKTRQSCQTCISFIMQDAQLCRKTRHSGLLPIQKISENTKVPRKTIERHRKYILAVVEILSGNYPYLAEYVRAFRKEQGNEVHHS